MNMMHQAKFGVRLLELVGVAVILFISLFPFYWMVSSSLKPAKEIFASPPTWIPSEITFENYRNLLSSGPNFARYFLNSAIIASGTVILTLIFAIAAAYAFSRYRFRGNKPLSLGFLATQFFPLTVVMIPLYMTISRLGLYNSYLGLIISYLVFALPLAVWLLIGVFESIPKELEEAAIVDGCTRAQALWKITLPLSSSGIAAVAIYVFMLAWNEFILALVLTSEDSMRTIQVGMASFFDQYGTRYDLLMSAGTLTSIPVVILFFFMQKQFVRGALAGAVKG